MKSQFVYVSYIITTPEKLWQALTTPTVLKKYWMGMETESDWKKGSGWKMTFPDGRVADAGEIVESNSPKRLAIRWRNEWNPELKNEGFSICTYDLEQVDGAVKLTVTHGNEIPNSRFIDTVSGAWPICMSNMKSLLETGDVAMKENPRHA